MKNIEKKNFKSFPALAPLPIVIATVGEYDEDDRKKYNALTIAWCGIINSNVPMLYISVQKQRYSYHFLKKTKQLVVNVPNKKIIKATDFIGVRTGAKMDKINEVGLNISRAKTVSPPIINECPINIECKIKKIISLGSHDMFICEISNVQIDKNYIDKNGRICYDKMGLSTYAHGEYFEIGKKIGKFGFSVKK